MNFKVLIPVAIDNPKRARNLDYCTRYFRDNGIEPIVIEHERHEYFPKSKICNDAYKIHKGIIYMCDVDCIIDINLLTKGYKIVKNNPKSMIYPFQRIKNIDPQQYYPNHTDYNNEKVIIEFLNNKPDLNLAFFQQLIFPNREPYKTDISNINLPELGMIHHMGYGFMFDYNAYKSIGLDNEYFLDYNFEDMERFVRMKKLGFNIQWLPGTLFHMDHSNDGQVGAVVRDTKQFITHNIFEFLKVINMNEEELKAYIDTWHWKSN